MGAHAHCWATFYANASSFQKPLQPSRLRFGRPSRAFDCCSSNRCRRRIVGSLTVGVEDVAQIIHNKVLIAAAASAAIGQLSKPFASAFLYGKGFDLRAAAQPGGFPSTHSSSVVAAATSIGLERGFSDSVFGLAVVYAAIVMYDAQGVRMEVGKHAQLMNEMLLKKAINSKIDYSNGKSMSAGSYTVEQTVQEEAVVGSYNSRSALAPMLLRQDDIEEEKAQGKAAGTSIIVTAPLKETVGHTKVEVVAGALLGFFTGLAVHAFDVA